MMKKDMLIAAAASGALAFGTLIVATQAGASDGSEFIVLPSGTCDRLTGGVVKD